MSRALDLSDQLIEQAQYSEAVPLLLQALRQSEDSLALGKGRSGALLAPQSCKNRALQSLRSLPLAGERAYKLEVEALSERAFAAAAKMGDTPALQAVVRDYPGSLAASQSLWLLSTMAIDRGHHQLAGALLRELEASEYRDEFEPQRSLLHA
ncbi:MAG: hypothetical protein AAF589_01875 [Planctomycetota bacterium]